MYTYKVLFMTGCLLVGSCTYSHISITMHQPFSVNLKTTTEQDLQQKDDKSTQVVLQGFAQVINNFFNILQAPNNVPNVATNLVVMLSSFAVAVAEAMKSNVNAIQQEEILNACNKLLRIRLAQIIHAQQNPNVSSAVLYKKIHII